MKTLILNGSPRKDGDTAYLINKLFSRLYGEYKIVDCYTADIAPCIDCRSCREKLSCPIRDEMQEIYAYLSECDHVIISSPVHYAELSSALLKVASRFQIYSSAQIFRHEMLPVKAKHGAVILAQGGSGGAECAYETARLIFQSIGIKEIYPLVCSRNTDHLHVVKDEQAISDVLKLAEWLNTFEDEHKNH